MLIDHPPKLIVGLALEQPTYVIVPISPRSGWVKGLATPDYVAVNFQPEISCRVHAINSLRKYRVRVRIRYT